MAINYSVLREGDIFFVADNGILSKLIRFFSKAVVSHVGFLFKPYGGKLFYKGEMMFDFWNPKKSDFQINPIKNEKNIVAIKRPIGIFATELERAKFRSNLLRWHEQKTLQYDLKELFSGIEIILGGDGSPGDKKKMICSRAVYEQLKLAGYKPDDKFEHYVTPDDLYDDPWLINVEGWRV